jgi:hypothetical protein
MVIGIVTDQSNNDPMTGVKILLQQQIGTVWTTIDSAVTASNGMYAIDSIQIGQYRVAASLSGYTAANQTLAVAANGTTLTRNFIMTAVTSVKGSVVNGTKKQTPTVNVVSGSLVLRNITEPGTVSLVGMNGRLVFQSSFSASASSFVLPRGSVQAGGVYLVTVTQKADVYRKELVIR